jgi:hypothetical protein
MPNPIKWNRERAPIDADAQTYFNNLYGEYRGLPDELIRNLTPEARGTLNEIFYKNVNNDLGCEHLYTFELILTQLKSNNQEMLSQLVRSLRSRYLRVAGQSEYDIYIASKPPDPSDTNKDKLYADAEFLLGAIHLRYALAQEREDARRALSKRIMRFMYGIIALILFGIASSIFSLSSLDKIPTAAASLAIVFLVGAMGGLVSIQQRFQSVTDAGDPYFTVFQLKRGDISVKSSAIGGGISAVILYLVIAGGLLKGAMFPDFGESQSPPCPSLAQFLRQLSPKGAPDYAKLIVWSFIAGFAERFVPDTLSRFVASKPSTPDPPSDKG